MKSLKILALTGCFIGAFAASAGAAAYNSDNDTTIDVTTGQELELPTYISAKVTEDVTTTAIQGALQNVEAATGEEMEYSYIYVKVDGENVAVIDPPGVGY